MYFVVNKDKGSDTEVDGRYYINVTLPLQELVNGTVTTIERTYKFLLDTGANVSLVPTSMLFGENLIKAVGVEGLMKNQEMRMCGTANKDNPVRGWYCRLPQIKVASHLLMNFTFLASDQIKEVYGILGCDFIDACKHSHDIGSSWIFRQFSPSEYRENWTHIRGDNNDVGLIDLCATDITASTIPINLPMEFD